MQVCCLAEIHFAVVFPPLGDAVLVWKKMSAHVHEMDQDCSVWNEVFLS